MGRCFCRGVMQDWPLPFPLLSWVSLGKGEDCARQCQTPPGVGQSCYLEAVGGGQAALLPEAEGGLQLLQGAQREGVGLVETTQQDQACREAGQVVAAWDTRGGMRLRLGVSDLLLPPPLLSQGAPAPPRQKGRVWGSSPSPVSKAGSSSSDMYSASSSSSGRSHWARTRLSSGRNSSAPAPSPMGGGGGSFRLLWDPRVRIHYLS